MKLFLFCIAVLAAWMPVFGQTQITGTIINAETQKGVIAASVELPDFKTGTYTDKYGNFKIDIEQVPVQLKVSHIGYETVSLILGTEFSVIELKPIVLHADEVLVTGKRAITGKTPIAFTTLDREDIDKLYSQQDVPMVLDMEPGVYAYSDAGNGSGYTYLNIRGFSQDRIGVMYNGVPLNDPEAHAVYWVDHGDVLNDASDIQVQRGIGNSLSSGAFGGSVNMESDISKLDPGVKASISYGNFLDGNNLNAPSGKRAISYVGNPFPEQGISFVFRFSDLESDGYRIESGTEQKSAHVGLQWVQPTHMTRAEYLWGSEATNFSWDGVSPQYGYDLNDMNDRRYNYYADTTYQGGYSNVNKDVFTQSIFLLNHTHLITDKIKAYGTVYYVNGDGYYQQFKGASDPDEYNVRSYIDTTEL
ncbi:MAG: TonB-dependent receptor plug domain-containing protein, partial [Candidatus Marinimicrobia bacterium]|nr:TonB-dependent receptor plug domain-containing protein [Candidatus Neomarinimicrobiota bacterium]